MIDISTYAEFCEWSATSWLFLSENVFDPLIYYSHLVPILLSLPLAILVLYQAPRERLNQYFFLIVAVFTTWSLSDLILWAHDDPSMIMSFWSLLILLEPLIYVFATLFAYTALFKKDVELWLISLLAILISPTILLLPTNFAIESFNLTNCWREVTEGPLVFYGYIAEIIMAIVIFGMMIYFVRNSTEEKETKNRSVLAVISILFFLGIFSWGNITGSLFEDWTIGQYGLFGMPVLVSFMTFLIAKYRIFQTRIIGAEILVGILAVLTAGILFIQNINTVKLVSVFTLALVLIIGTILIQSIRKEDSQREEIEALAQRLKGVNKRLKQLDQMKSEFVSIASHQLRSPLTSIRGYTSMLLEGSYGKITPKAKDVLQHIADSSKFMALSVEDYLNVSRIESGNMKYELSDFNLKTLAETVADELRPQGIKRGLLLTFKSDVSSRSLVHADIGKTKQVIQNLVDNSMKYTPKGTVAIHVHDDKKAKKIYVDISDTGIGMSEETQKSVFEKFERAHNANSVNVTGTGLGLFVARTMARAMGGDVTASSEGEGKGSLFRLELPLQM